MELRSARIPDWFASHTGAVPAQSALGLRLVLALFGFALFAVTTVVFLVLELPTGAVVVAAILAVVALVDLVVISRRRAGGPSVRRPGKSE